MFPPSGAEIFRNELGEPTGWSAPAEAVFCDLCGGRGHNELYCSTQYEDLDYEEEDDYDPGPEVDDEGETSEYRHQLPNEEPSF